MIAWVIALSVLLALAIVGLVRVWLLYERARTAVAEGRSTLARVDEQRSHFEGQWSTLRASEDVMRERVEALGRERSALVERVQGMQQLFDALQREQAEREQSLKQYVAQRDAELGQRFKALATESLKGANETLLTLAHERFTRLQTESQAELEKRQQAVSRLVEPISETLKKTDEKLAKLHSDWNKDQSTLQEQMRTLGSAGDLLRQETSKLARALSKPEVRGRYGEIQLKRVAELAGMVSYCDFEEQAQQQDDEGRSLRPDMIVRLPNERMIAIDAKCPIFAYVEALESATDEAREECLERFAGHVDKQVTLLASKRYWAQLSGSPEFVVMFVPGDQFLDAALSRRSDLLERAAQNRVILASPATLIGLLKAVHVGWRERQIQEEAQELFKLGKQLLDRTSNALGHLVGVGTSLQSATNRFNAFVGSYESLLKPVLRKFKDAGVQGKDLPQLEHIDLAIRSLQPFSPPHEHLDVQEDSELVPPEQRPLETAAGDGVA